MCSSQLGLRGLEKIDIYRVMTCSTKRVMVSNRRDPINPHVMCGICNEIILKKKSYKHFIWITTYTGKKDRHITYINSKFNFNKTGSRNTSWSAKSTLCLHSRHQTTIFLPILWLLDKRRMGTEIASNPFMERIIKNTFLIILVSLFSFSLKKKNKNSFFFSHRKRMNTLLSNFLSENQKWQNYRKISYFSIFTNL